MNWEIRQHLPTYTRLIGKRWVFELFTCCGLLVGFTVLVDPTPGVAINLLFTTVLIWRQPAAPQAPTP